MLFGNFLLIHCMLLVSAYVNNLFTIKSEIHDFNQTYCDGSKDVPNSILSDQRMSKNDLDYMNITIYSDNLLNVSFETIEGNLHTGKDPFQSLQKDVYQLLFGNKTDIQSQFRTLIEIPEAVSLAHYVSGQYMRSELFMNKSSVHLPSPEFVYQGYGHLKMTKDYMQTAVDAFSIFVYGSLEDILRLPSSYVLRSARTISMMKIAEEKLVATWEVVKGNRLTEEIDIKTLELYRPLFKYVKAIEMTKLNLSDENILYYVGTHADLDRHQVGAVANRYMQLNPNWAQPKYLNLMNNIICGIPMSHMKVLSMNTFLQLSQQLFYHIRACTPLQRRFYLACMMKTQALGKSYSWSAPDVSRLGLLLAEVHENDLCLIKPESMAGISAQVMLEIPAYRLKFITDKQLLHIEPKPFNIYVRKSNKYNDLQQLFNNALIVNKDVTLFIIVIKIYL